MRVEFTKMHGLGNDFIVFDLPDDAHWPSREQWRALADRHTGIGFDQALVLLPARDPDTQAFYRIINADGGEVEQCGNGARCVAALLAARNRALKGRLSMGSSAGVVHARVLDDGQVSINFGVPNFTPSALPFEAPQTADRYTLQLADQSIEVGAVSIGNPHVVMRVDSVNDAPVERIGPALQHHARFPRAVNVGFMQPLDATHLRLRVYERGAGETRACGTGACAAAVIGRHWGLLDSDVQVSVPGGVLSVHWQGPGQPVWLTGPAQTSFEGRVEI